MTEPDPAALLARRESTIVLGADGRFLHDGTPIEHPGLVRAFRRWLGRGPGGRYVLRASEREWCFVAVEGPAAWVEEVAVGPGEVTVGLWDGTRERLDPATLRVEGDGALACTVRDLPARFTRHAQLSLGEHLEAAPDGGVALVVGTRRWPLG